jgi:plastocyanin
MRHTIAASALIVALLLVVDATAAWSPLLKLAPRNGVPYENATELVQARGGSIRGRFDVGRRNRLPDRRPEVAELGAAAPRGLPDLRRGVVYLETAPAAALEERETTRATLDQRNETFVPHVLAVTVGTIVDFPNSDRTYHNVFSLSRAKRFDLGRYAAGRSRPVQFDRPGVVRVFCDIHSHMSAFVLVFNHPFYDVVDAEGRFRIENVPQGTYNVIAWYEGEARANRSVAVPQGGVIDLDFTVP